MTQRPLLIIKTGTKLPSLAEHPGDYEEWIAAGAGLKRDEWFVVAVHEGETLPPLERVGGVAITGSAAMVTDGADWVETCAHWLREAVAEGMPVLGICFGHQLLAHALGGEVGYNRLGVEVGTVSIHLTPAARHDRLFHDLPTEFHAQASHRQSVLALPNGAMRLAWNERDSNHAFAYPPCAWGIQFHPEFDAGICARYVENYAEVLREEGRETAPLLERLQDDPNARELLRRFVRLRLE